MHPTLLLITGLWRAVLSLPDAPLPFTFDLNQTNKGCVITIHNATENITCDNVKLVGDSIIIRFAVYDSEIRAKVENGQMHGNWINYGRKGTPVIPFDAVAGNLSRFPVSKSANFSMQGNWETWFDTDTPDSSAAVGVFHQEGQIVTGTFLTESGDHRFIEGVVEGDSLKMSVFDGSHCWLYLAKYDGQLLNGAFYSGNHFKGPFHAHINKAFHLRNPENITRVEGPLDFSFYDADSNKVSLADVRFKNKVVIIQIMGTWCPNCMDETAFFAKYYKEHHQEGIEMIGLAFERFPDFKIASANLNRLKAKYQIDYPLLIAGVSGKENVMKTLPAIKDFFSFPTSIYINRTGKVVKVYTGFSGPATGQEYEDYKKHFDQTVKAMLKE